MTFNPSERCRFSIKDEEWRLKLEYLGYLGDSESDV